MSCPKSEVALYAGGDLPPRRGARVQAHLAACHECRALLEELRASQIALAELRTEPLEDAMLAQLRRRVMAEVAAAEETRAGIWRYWKFAVAAVVAALIVMLVWPRQSHRAAPLAPHRELAHAGPAPPAPAAVIPVQHPAARRRRRAPGRHRVQSPVQHGAPLLVQFVTDDPNVVIYWVVEETSKGG